MSKEFIMDTLTSRNTAFRGPSGQSYVIYRNKAFRVDADDDIAFFESNKRFSVAGKKAKNEAGKKEKAIVEPDFEAELKAIKGITAKTAKLLAETYVAKNHLEDAVLNDYNLHEEVTEKQQNIIKKHYGGKQ